MIGFFRRHDMCVVVALIAFVLPLVLGRAALNEANAKNKRSLAAIESEAEIQKAVNDGLLHRISTLEGEVQTARRDSDDLRNRLSNAAEQSRAAKVRASRSRRLPVQGTPAGHGDTEGRTESSGPVQGGGWATSVRGNKIANCESADLMHWPYSDGSRYLGGERGVHLHDQARYTGKWQIGPSEWRDWGGLKYAPTPWQATEAEQDVVANNGYAARGEQPWVCARKV